MRTTISLDDHLLTRLKKRASESNSSVSALIERAVRLLLQTPVAPKQKQGFDLVTFGAGGKFSRRNIDKTSALLEAEDVDQFAGRR
jgi:ribbon-helix-helix CopG family protein